ncbi:MAG: TonB family protein [Flavobacteriales bacterium]|nr:TonB family protein [Flavobacteriales bacterium]
MNKKSKESDLEKWRMPLFLLGISFSAALVLSAFEWRTPNHYQSVDEIGEFNTFELPPEPILASVPRPPEPPTQSKPNPDKLILVDKPTPKPVAPDDANKDLSADPILEPIDFPPEKYTEEPVAPNTPIDHPDVYPEFPGGDAGLFGYLKSNTRFPQMERDARMQGKVYAEFVVNEKGEVEQVKILRGLAAGFDREAVRVISGMPNWKPGLQNGEPVSVRYRLPIHFVLKN